MAMSALSASAELVKGHLAVGSRVLARWSDGTYYPGSIARIVGRALYIHYDDGDERWVPLSGIAVVEMPPTKNE